jgi:F-type H+-transporting ATPase subunit epsilon
MLFDDDVDIVTAPSVEGMMGILPRHAPLVATLGYGELVVRRGEIEESFAIGGGVLQVAHNQVVVLADSAEQAEEIDMARAEEARSRAERMMSEGEPKDPSAMAALEAAIRRADLRLKVARKRRGRRGTGPEALDLK